MKKHIVFLALFTVFFTATIFGQKTGPGYSTPKDQWIWNEINDPTTKVFWSREHISPDPNTSVNYGDSIPFYFDGETVWTAPADSAGESPWSLMGDWYDINVAPANTAATRDTIIVHTTYQGFFDRLTEFQLFGLLLLFCLLVFAVFLILKNREMLFGKDKNPVIAGPLVEEEPIVLTGENAAEIAPVYANGLTDDTITGHIVNQMNREGKILPIAGIKSGLLYSMEPVNVAFNDNNRPALLRGVPGYEVTLDLGEGKTTKRYTLKPCGNDVCREDDKGIQNIIFVPDEIQSPVLSPVIETIVEEAATTHPETGEVTEFMNVIQKILENKKSGHVRFSSSIDGTMIDVSFQEPRLTGIVVGGLYSAQDLFGR